MATLPYVTSPGNIEKALEGIRTAETPERVTQDFVKTILKIRGGSGNQIASFLKKIGFVNSDGTPSEIYKKFRNRAGSGGAIAEAMKIGFAPLYKRNEFMHRLSEGELRGLVLEESGQSEESSVPGLIVGAISALKKYLKEQKIAGKSEENIEGKEATKAENGGIGNLSKKIGMNLSYTINLNLPSTSEIAVFNAIFKSLKDNLLKDIYEE